jgi:Tol biopolymer transport system component/DNA-binding winged helix-turn-helix (wHTH) protein
MNQAHERRIRFGPYEADLKTAELRKNGRLVRLQEQPFQVLAALLVRDGEVVTREELRERLWPSDSFGDFDQGLNTAINKVREALGDSAANARFIETLPKRGYRFMYAIEAEPTVSTAAGVHVEPVRTRKPALLLVTAVIFAIAAAGFAVLWIRRPALEPQLPLRQFAIRWPVPISTIRHVRLVAISPNGRHVAITADEGPSKLWIQDLDQQQPRAVEGSEGAQSPFWSPDSSMIAFITAGKLKKVSVKGGPVIPLCDMSGVYITGGAWSPDGGSIVFSAGSPSKLYTVGAIGGIASLLVSPQMLEPQPKGDGWLVQPYFLPAAGVARTVLFVNSGSLMVWDLKTGQHHIIGPAHTVSYSPSGHLLFRSGTDLWAQAFSLKHVSFQGEAFRVARNATDPSVASDGTLVYRDAVTEQLVWVDRRGARIETVGQPVSGFYYPVLSPDEHRVAVETLENGNLDLWVADLLRGTRVRLTSHPAAEVIPVWAPGGDRVAFSSYRSGNTDIFARTADAGLDETLLAASEPNERISDWSRDGQYIPYSLQHPKNGYDLWYLKRNAGKWEPHPLLQTSFNEKVPKLSPDGRYVAYLSDESGRDELYVRQFPSGEHKWLISTRGASQIRWSRTGREIFYSEAGTLIAVSVRTKPEFEVGPATRLFSHAAFTIWHDANYDVSADGRRILLPESVGGERMIHVVQNWFAEFRDQQ